MTSKPNPDSPQDDPVENFRKRLAAVRRKVFGAPFRPWRELGGLTYAFASDIVAHRAKALEAADQSSLADAIRDAWPDSDPTYQKMIQRRYLEAFLVPPAEAVMAVSRGYSSPQAAMRSGVIRRRKRVGFMGERTP